MKVGTRLYLSVLPAVLGVLLVAALGYWGQFAHSVPEAVLVIAAIAAVGSLVLAWNNTRYVAQRIERLAEHDHRSARPSADDEFESLERVVEYANVLAETSAALSRRLDEVRLPLHILIENKFGELNENQEEMLSAARAAIEQADIDLRRLRDIAQLDQGALSLRRDAIKIGDLIASLLPTLRSRADAEGVRLLVNVAPAGPRVLGDPTRLREALVLLLARRVEQTPPGETVHLDVDHDRQLVRVSARHGTLGMVTSEEMLAQRLLEAHGATIETTGTQTLVTLPVHTTAIGPTAGA